MPCLVETESLFDGDRGLSLQERGYVLNIQRLCIATQRLRLVRQTCCIVFEESTNTEFYRFQTDNSFSKHLFLSLTGLKYWFIQNFSTSEAAVWLIQIYV